MDIKLKIAAKSSVQDLRRPTTLPAVSTAVVKNFISSVSDFMQKSHARVSNENMVKK